jgi:hypothetical protein
MSWRRNTAGVFLITACYALAIGKHVHRAGKTVARFVRGLA